MADIPLTSVAGGGGLPRLAPDLTFPSTRSTTNAYTRVILNPVGSLTTALSLSGKFYIGLLQFGSLTSETITIKLTVDGVVVWNDTYICGSSVPLLGNNAATGANSDAMMCNSSFLLEIQTATDSSVTFDYLARPIL